MPDLAEGVTVGVTSLAELVGGVTVGLAGVASLADFAGSVAAGGVMFLTDPVSVVTDGVTSPE